MNFERTDTAVIDDTNNADSKRVNDETYLGENMNDKTEESAIKPIVGIGVGSNFYYNKGLEHPASKYRYSSFLKFSLTNKKLLQYIYRYFGYDEEKKTMLPSSKGWLIPGSCADARRPHTYFSTQALLVDFVTYLTEKVDLVEVKSGRLITSDSPSVEIKRRIFSPKSKV